MCIKRKRSIEDMNYTSELEKKYNEICGATMTNIYTTTKKWKTIPITDLNLKNPEHLFVLNVALAIGGVVEKPVAIQASKFKLWRINKKLHLKYKGTKIVAITEELEDVIKPNDLLEYMYPWASELCGQDFGFSDIYHEFYELKKGKR
jgi:hypothetical protein